MSRMSCRRWAFLRCMYLGIPSDRTPAATAPNQVDPKVMAERKEKCVICTRFDAAKKLAGTR